MSASVVEFIIVETVYKAVNQLAASGLYWQQPSAGSHQVERGCMSSANAPSLP